MSDREVHVGRIVHANNQGMYVVIEPLTNAEYVFTLNKVQAYDGRDPRQLGLALGNEVQFTLERGKILEVAPTQSDRARASDP